LWLGREKDAKILNRKQTMDQSLTHQAEGKKTKKMPLDEGKKGALLGSQSSGRSATMIK